MTRLWCRRCGCDAVPCVSCAADLAVLERIAADMRASNRALLDVAGVLHRHDRVLRRVEQAIEGCRA